MRCPFCQSFEDRVIDSRASKDGREIRRRRECEGCARRYTTYERIEEALPVVVKADGRREPFDRNKIEGGLKRAVAKRPVSVVALALLAEEVEREIGDLGVQEIASKEIGARVLPRLRGLDEVSYVRYASIYRDFRDIEEFVRELGEVRRARDEPASPRGRDLAGDEPASPRVGDLAVDPAVAATWSPALTLAPVDGGGGAGDRPPDRPRG